MYPGLKIKLNKSEMHAFHLIVTTQLNSLKSDVLTRYAMKDVFHELLLSFARRMLLNKEKHTVTLKPHQVFFLMDLISGCEHKFGSFETTLMYKLYTEIDRYIKNIIL